MATTRIWVKLAAVLLAGGLVASACGGDGDDGEATPTTITDATASDPVDDTTTTTPTTTGPATSDEPLDETTTTTEPPPLSDPIPVIDAGDIPDLVTAWADGTAPSLELARDIIGFPIELPAPSDGGAARLELDMDGLDPDEPWTWDWNYVVAAAEPFGDIDIALDDNGAGAVALRDFYDPVLADLGWSYSNSTGSDPSSGAGGPQSINHVYQNDAGTVRLGEIDAETNPLFVWADENIAFSDATEQPGYRIDVSLDAQPNFIPVPMLEALFREVPVAPGARLYDIQLRTQERAADSFAAEYGLRYIDLEYTCELLPNSANAAQEVYTAGLEGSVYQVGEESFFNPGEIERTEPVVNGDRWTQSVVVLDRYPGEIEVETDPATGAVTSTVSIRLEPNRAVLTTPSE